MMKYKEGYWLLVAGVMRGPMVKWYGDMFTDVVLRRAKPIYRDMLAKTDDIGADNPMASNLYMCYPIFAIWKAAAGKIKLDDYRKIINSLVTSPIMQKAALIMPDCNTPSCLAAVEDMMHKNADWIKMHPQYADVSWDFNFDETRHRDGFYYHFTRCPIERFARENGLLDVLPILCDIDYATGKLFHVKLHREQTLASGGSVCDYWFIPDKIEHPQ